MKKIMFLFLALFMGTLLASAQDKMASTDTSGSKMGAMSKTDTKMKDYITLKDGKVWSVKQGTKMELMQDMTLSNGTMVMKDGSVKTKDGKMYKLGEGDVIYSNGKLKKMTPAKM